MTDIQGFAPSAGVIEFDEIAPHQLGDRLIPDPANPRRAIPDPGALEKRASAARLEAAIAAKQRQMALARLTIEDEFPGAAEALAAVEAEQTALIDAAKALAESASPLK